MSQIESIAHKMVGVQPMSKPLGVAYAMRTIYQSDFDIGVDMAKTYYTIDWTAGMIQSRPSHKHPVPHHSKKDTDTIHERRNREYHNDHIPKKKKEFVVDNDKHFSRCQYVPYNVLYRRHILKEDPIRMPSMKTLYAIRRRLYRSRLPVIVGVL